MSGEQPKPSRETLADLFQEIAELEREYLIHDNGYRSWTYTYAQIARAARGFAARLAAAGIGRGDKVVLWSENRPEWIAVFWGCVLQGVVVVPIDFQSSSAFVMHVREIVQARVVLIGDSVPQSAIEAVPVWRVADIQWAEGATVPQAEIRKDDVVEIVFTSGATAEPKGVLITHRNILANLAGPERVISRYRKYLRRLPPLRFLNLIPLSHMFGQMLALFVLPVIPGTAVFMRGFNPGEIARQIRRYKITALIAVPKILEVLRAYFIHEFPEAARPDSSHWMKRWFHFRRVHARLGWRFWAFIVGGAPLSRDLEEFWRKLGLPVIQGYGLTETAPIVALNNPFSIQPGSAGRVIAGTEVRIEADGEISVRGENVSPGYFGAPPDASQAFRDGWFHTGDIGEVDASGNLVIRGRKKEMIVLPDGRKVYPDDVENVLLQLAGVREAAVVGRDRVHAVLVVDPGADPNAIVGGANAKLEDHQKIKAVTIWPDAKLPRTEATHKVKRAAIQKWLDTGGQALPARAAATVMDIVRQHAPGREVSQATTLDDLGLSSLERVELLVELEQHVGTRIDETQLTGTSTVAGLEALPSPPAPTKFPSWNREWYARAARKAALAPLLLPLTRCFAHIKVSGRENLQDLRGPVIFAPNHQSHLDTPVILASLPSRYRHRTAVAMWKEYFDAHFFPARHSVKDRIASNLTYFSATLLFNAFPLPQTEAGAGESLRYMGELVSAGWSILFFPEGERSETGEIGEFQAGIGFIAARLGVPVIPVRLTGVEKVLHRADRFPRPGPVKVAFGMPLLLKGENFEELASQVRRAVSEL